MMITFMDQSREIQGVVQSSTITGSFWCNKDLEEKVFFEEWIKQIYQLG